MKKYHPTQIFLPYFALLLLLLSTANCVAQTTRIYHRQIVKTEKKITKAFRNISQKNQETPLGYWQQEYIATMDPQLLRPTPEALLPQLHNPINKRTAPGLPETPWISRGPNNVGGRTRALCFDPNDNTGKKVWAGAVTGGLWYNNDISHADSTWTSVSTLWPNLTVTCIAFDPNNAQTIYVGTGEGFGSTFSSSRGYGIFKSTNGGNSWTHLSSTADFNYINDLIVRNENGSSVLYAATDILFYGGQWNGSPTQIGLMRSTNGGTSFTNVMPISRHSI
jgi:hypothetical protein